MFEALQVLQSKGKGASVKVKFSGTADAPFELLKDEVGAFLISKGYAVAEVDATQYGVTIRISGGAQ